MDCSDRIGLQRLLDGDLEETQAELVAHHLESCPTCRAAARELTTLRSFVQDELGSEDRAEEGAAAAVLAAIAGRLPASEASQPVSTAWWRRTWLAAAAVAVLALLLPLVFGAPAGASAEGILQEVVVRERIWAYQPNKVLHWEIETVSSGNRGVADGRWRTLFSQKNGATTFAQTSRQFDPDGRTTHAYWQHPDGSSINYQRKSGVVELWPSTAAARAALPSLTPDLQAALESYLQSRETTRTLDVRIRRKAEWLHHPFAGIAGATATLRRGLLDRWGDVYHITVTKTRTNVNSEILRAIHEYDVERATYRVLRLKSTLTYSDGSTGIHDSRWTVFREASDAEFDAQTPRDLLTGGLPVVRLTPLDVARRRLQELSRDRTRTN